MNVYSPMGLTNAILSGLVAITACSNISTASSLVIGLISSLLYMATAKLYQRYKIDDPLEASIVHGICGFWGVLAVGIFDMEVGLLYTGSIDQL